MLIEYGRQRRRLALLKRYGAIVTHSSHMRDEYLRHGFNPDAVHNIFYCTESAIGARAGLATRTAMTAERARVGDARLLFVGRMDPLKGGRTLLDALPSVRARFNGTLHVT